MRRTLLLLALLLPACAERWERPGTTEAEAEATAAQCANAAALEVPPHFVWQVVEPARIERDRDCWVDRDGRRRCAVFERFRPPRWGQVDVNAGPRDASRRQCMAEKGFTFGGYRPLRLN
ncbi:MAG TPA: hypothetical protein VE033_15425 [Acetobacteraceae bacterium]|nr:hypothetical protein [Acetobacteraceae bacterium]